MDKNKSKRVEYSRYCLEHAKEFRNELRDDASLAIISWPGRSVALLMILSSAISFFEATEGKNPFAVYILFSYSVPILIVLLFPILTILNSTLEKYSPIVLDLVCLLGLLSYCLTIHFVLVGMDPESDVQGVYLQLSGQVNMILLLAITFSYHVSFVFTVLRNAAFATVFGLLLFYVDYDFFVANYIQLVQGFFAGIIMSWIFYETERTRFYLKSTDADTRQHLYNQLSKLVYPHQLERIKLGDQLENTMPLKEGKGIINVFDVQKSSEIRHEKTQDFL